MKIRLLFFVIISIVFSCKKRDTNTYPLPDYTAEIEAEFPYKDIKKPLIFMNSDSSKLQTITFKSKSTYRSKNTIRQESLNRLQSFCSVNANAENFSYSVSAQSPIEFGHRIVFYNVSTSLGNQSLMAGDNLSISKVHSLLILFDKEYYDVYEFYANGDFNSSNRPISRILVNTKNGLLGYFNTDEQDWFYLKQ